MHKYVVFAGLALFAVAVVALSRTLDGSALAAPRSLAQVGLPPQAMQAALPADDPLTPEKVELGRKLFFEPLLSADGSVSCATCHDPARAFTDGRPVSVGIHGRAGQRNAPTVLNALFNKAQFWDGRAATLEAQAALPITNPSEMGQPNLVAAAEAIAALRSYREAFLAAFGRELNGADLVRAIAAYERTLVSFESPFDRFDAGEEDAIDYAAQRGWELFNTKAHCNRCHAPSAKERDPTYFTDFDYHNIGIGIPGRHLPQAWRDAERQIAAGTLEAVDRAAIDSELSVLGRFLVTRKDTDAAAFRTPGLRNVLVTAPYFHDGSQATLWDVIDHYNKGDGLHDAWLDEDIEPLALSDEEIDDLVAFLASLTSPEYRSLGERELARQRAIAQKSRPQRDVQRAFAPKPRVSSITLETAGRGA